ncbi:hypothetical protein F4777DRAFT_582848 [Nemania sp. FL0916]|nr:hypothetical protein F4777DRAFT_582848 [Nemania sp. FL0916]
MENVGVSAPLSPNMEADVTVIKTEPKNRWPQPQPRILEHGLHALREALWSDAMLIAIDFEGAVNIRAGFPNNQYCQAGLAILDTRDLQQGGHLSEESEASEESEEYEESEDLITVRNFIAGSPNYLTRASQRFLFGESSIIDPTKLLEIIQPLIPQDRHIVLLGHGVNIELGVLRALGFNIATHAPTSVVVDTLRVANEVLGRGPGRLRDVLLRVGCPFMRLHSAGNDAYFALRAALHLATKNDDRADEPILDCLRQYLTQPVPYKFSPGEAKAFAKQQIRKEMQKERQERQERGVKRRPKQPKHRSIEQQNRLREKRAARKAAREAEVQDDDTLSFIYRELFADARTQDFQLMMARYRIGPPYLTYSSYQPD